MLRKVYNIKYIVCLSYFIILPKSCIGNFYAQKLIDSEEIHPEASQDEMLPENLMMKIK